MGYKFLQAHPKILRKAFPEQYRPLKPWGGGQLHINGHWKGGGAIFDGDGLEWDVQQAPIDVRVRCLQKFARIL